MKNKNKGKFSKKGGGGKKNPQFPFGSLETPWGGLKLKKKKAEFQIPLRPHPKKNNDIT